MLQSPPSPCVLLVEDDTSLRQSLSIHFEREEINVDVAEDGAEAIRLLELRTYDVIVLDLNLPKVSGREVIDFLAMNRNHRPQIVVITGEDLDNAAYAEPSVVARTFTKPLDFSELTKVVRELCAKN